MPIDIFISHADHDQPFADALRKHLASLERSGAIRVASERDIPAGAVWPDDLRAKVGAAHVVLLLISADFFAHEPCAELVVETALEAREKRGATVVPILVRHYDWKISRLAHLTPLPRSGQPVQDAPSDKAWAEIAAEIRDLVAGLVRSSQPTPPAPPAPAPVAPAAPAPRASPAPLAAAPVFAWRAPVVGPPYSFDAAGAFRWPDPPALPLWRFTP